MKEKRLESLYEKLKNYGATAVEHLTYITENDLGNALGLLLHYNIFVTSNY